MEKKDSDISKMLIELKKNNIAGANELVFKALEIVESQLNLIVDNNENIKEKMIELAREIIHSHPSIAPLITIMGRILQKSEILNKQTIQERLTKLEKDRISRTRALEENFHKFLTQNQKSHCKIMLISYSSTIVNLLLKCKNRPIEIFVLESRPLLEGQKTAEILSQWFKTHLIIDVAIGKFIDQIDFVLVGADSILKNGSVINKIGTFPLAVLAKVKNVSLYAVADSYKYNLRSHFDQEILIEKKPIEEIYNKPEKSSLLEIDNYYFDETPSKYITGIISELGILSMENFLEKVRAGLPIEGFKYFLEK